MLRDLRFSLRSLRRSPGFAGVAILTLGVGIGVTTLMFSVVYGVLIKGLPFRAPDTIVVVQHRKPAQGADQLPVSVHDYLDYRAAQRSFADLAAYTSGSINVSGTAGAAERYSAARVTPNTFSLLGVGPMLGRDFLATEGVPGGPLAAMLSHATWHNRYAGDSTIIGKTVRINSIPHTIVGVMPPGFRFPDNNAIWLSLQLDAARVPRGQGEPLRVWGRLRSDLTVALAKADVGAIARRLQAEYPRTNDGVEAEVRTWIDGELGPLRQFLYTMLGAVFCVLLMACANVANLLLTRAAQKSREVGIRSALGATRIAVVRPFLSDALLISAGAAAIGILAAAYGVGAFNAAIIDTQPPFYIDIRLHPPVLVFAIAVALLASVISAVIPAYQSARANLSDVLKDDARGSTGLRVGRVSRGLVVFEVMLSCVLLVGAGLMIESVVKLGGLETGFEMGGVFTGRVGLAGAALEPATQPGFFERLQERLTTVPGVQRVALSSSLPGIFGGVTPFGVDGTEYRRSDDYPNAGVRSVSSGFFDTFGIRLMAGRSLDATDRAESAPVAVVSRSVADQLFAGRGAIGRRIRIGGPQAADAWRMIVGVVGDAYSGNPSRPWMHQIYVPLAQSHVDAVDVGLRSGAAPLALVEPVRNVVAALDPDLPLYAVMTMDEALARPAWKVRVFGRMFAGFGLTALMLAAVGLYAVMAFAVSRRTREVGIRMALGARPAAVVAMVLRQGGWQLSLGMVLGLGLAAGVGQLLSLVLFDVEPRDPVIFVGVAVVLFTAGLLACIVPARRAASVDPMVAFRGE